MQRTRGKGSRLDPEPSASQEGAGAVLIPRGSGAALKERRGGWWPLPTGETQPGMLRAQPRCLGRRGHLADLKFRAAYLLCLSSRTEKNTGRERAGAFARVSCDGGDTRIALFPNLEIGLRGLLSAIVGAVGENDEGESGGFFACLYRSVCGQDAAGPYKNVTGWIRSGNGGHIGFLS